MCWRVLGVEKWIEIEAVDFANGLGLRRSIVAQGTKESCVEEGRFMSNGEGKCREFLVVKRNGEIPIVEVLYEGYDLLRRIRLHLSRKRLGQEWQ